MPNSGAKKLAANGSIETRVCRREETTGACEAAGQPLLLAPGSAVSFSEVLPEGLTAGAPRVLYYEVELLDGSGEPTGLSNSVATLAGAPPPAIRGLTAALTDKGVWLRWTPFASDAGAEGMAVQIHRIEILPPATQAMRDGLVPLPTREVQNFMVEDGAKSGQALVASGGKGGTYAYQVQRVFRTEAGGQTLELDGLLSEPVRVDIPK